MESINYTNIIIVISLAIILQVGLTKRRKITEEEKRKRLNIFKDMDDFKINAIGNHEEKAKNKLIK
tara:strand:- start:5 stop:202 length:198 start_codon:yes stop_codon:yes gene_type:complete